MAFILVSDKFLGSHPYLTDSAVLVRNSDTPGADSEGQGGPGFYDICQMGTHTYYSFNYVQLKRVQFGHLGVGHIRKVQLGKQIVYITRESRAKPLN